MTNQQEQGKPSQESAVGPQGTQMFELSDVNKMIAQEIAQTQTDEADIPALIGVSENVSGMRIILNKDKMEVGRRPNSDIRLTDNSVSSMHAHIIREGTYCKVLNLLSSNGTFVNGEKVAEKYLVPGDRVAFAATEFVFMLIEEGDSSKSTSKNRAVYLAAILLTLAFAGLLFYLL
ncbi:FHA domain-containing protein [Aliikangiella maris]|uniref:FHA domain-containing protein n=2 Tax=Aliikangiella maris TaxID=3162458 RepID=A0ABV2BXF5_9GAMM